MNKELLTYRATVWDSRTNETSTHDIDLIREELSVMTDERFLSILHAGVCHSTGEDEGAFKRVDDTAHMKDAGGYPSHGTSTWQENSRRGYTPTLGTEVISTMAYVRIK